MNEITLRATVAGLFFGVWPLLMNRSGLSGATSSAVFSGMTFVIVLPFALKEANTSNLAMVIWRFAFLAGVAGAIGVLAFNGGLSKVTPQTVGMYFVMMMCVQIALPAVYHVVMTGEVSASKVLGFVLALTAGYLLNK